jgi:hypothetical protein
MAQSTRESSPQRSWANSSLAAGIAWVVLAVLPVPGTTTLGLPFGVYAIFAGLFSHAERRTAGDRTGARRARWGVGLGCLGFLIAVALDLIVAGVVLAAVIAAIRAAWGVHFR